ncbi:demethylmenaquinone methyltransferase-like [Haliotis rufescens]|uniref:demethylmenaquinone methyltransferase-like n=1 Tax=Haliotis rufescens TaxID=6454 RepID=UPI00201E8350|nr:demethylmenaquinone methyltransferase-like [Haliotis rufescens]XP_046379098.2 demethylmenaquinone methyltransferase-like [Haliotis rufescens]
MSGRHMDARHNYNLRRTMTPKQIADMFNDFADDYEEVYKGLGLCSHLRIGEYMAETYPEHLRAALQVLDVGAGTGYVGETLSELGFKRIDALDPAQKMLDVAKTKKVYRRLICAFLNKNRIDEIETDQYDCITAAGAFNEGLIPVSAFQEMIRIVKPGGRIIFTITDKYIANTDGYRKELLPFIQKMADEGAWDITAVPLADGAIHRPDGPGMLYSFKVNVTEKHL